MHHRSTQHWAYGIPSVLVMQRIVYEDRNDFHFCKKNLSDSLGLTIVILGQSDELWIYFISCR